MKTLAQFTNKYQLSKTLKFELIPQGKTDYYIEKNGILNKDEQRAEDYKKVKKIIDDYHKYFINIALDGQSLTGLDEYFYLYKIAQKDDTQKKQFEDVQLKLRKQISERFSKHPNSEIRNKFKNLFAKELIKEDLINFVSNNDDLLLVKGFENFTTYFTGFHENRANMYVPEDKSTAIAFRLIHQNLPKFIDNMRLFEKVMHSPVKDKLPELLINLEPYIQVNDVSEMFELNYFNETLTQIGIDKYNYLLGGYVSDDGKLKIKGLNEYINLHNQIAKKEDKIGRLKPLFKQILSDRNTISFLQEEFTSDTDLLEAVEKLYQELKTYVFDVSDNNITTLPELITQLNTFDLDKVYLKNDLGLTDISQKMFGTWSVFQQAIYAEFTVNYKGKVKPDTEKYEQEQAKYFKRFDSFSIAHLNEALRLLPDASLHKNVEDYFKLLGRNETQGQPDLFTLTEQHYDAAQNLLNSYSNNKSLVQDQAAIEKLKALLDSIKNIQHFVKPLLGKGNEPEKDDKFYGELDKIWNTLDQITPMYNKVRNYVTRKPYSLEKFKLNFENSTLLDGWDANKEEANTSVLLEKEGNYYLAIMDKKHNKVFRDLPSPLSSDDALLKMSYLQAADPSKDVQNLMVINGVTVKKNGRKEKDGENIGENLVLEALKNEHLPTEINEIRKRKSYSKPNENFSKSDLVKFIDYYKLRTIEYFKAFKFEFYPSELYSNFSDFTEHINQQAYQINFKKVSHKYINQLVDEGKLYLFKIYNKDFSPNSKGTPNMHTLYWRMLFDENNLKNVVYKLNGQAEVFYRKASIKPENAIVHKAHEAINNKNLLNPKKQSTFDYDIVKDKRFTVNKYQFHVPITLNFKANGTGNINLDVNEFIQQNGISHIIGIDRGERHLLYLTVINIKGEIVEQFSLNEIVNEYNGQQHRINYHNLLATKEGDRDEARKNWKTIENIKELKEGYLSQVIHKITQLMVKYNAIVVLEDLNTGFMRGRQKVEKQVYQKFEKMLIDKLNYYVDKKAEATEVGGSLNALQLTNQFVNFQKLGKQSGFLYYVPAWNTSKIDPVTGFVSLFNTKYENQEKAIAFFKKFDAIRFNKNQNYFEFSFNYKNFTNKDAGIKTNWTVCTYGDRVITYRNKEKNNQWDNKEVNLTQEFINLFNKHQIDYNQSNLQAQITNTTDKAFLEALLNLFKLTLQLRNSITNSEVDYLISPVADENGYFFDSRKAPVYLPQNADANGANNIARKGLWVVEQIKQTKDLKKLKLAITNAEWLSFVQATEV